MFRTLDDLKKDEKKDDKKDKKTNTFYTGGEKSGMAVETPDHVDKIIQKAQQDSGAPCDKADATVKITIYKNGFTVNDGPLRSMEDPAEKKFLAALHQGHVPEELRSKYGDKIDMELEIKRGEDYKEPPPPKYVAYSGAGVSLGGAPTQTQPQTKTTPQAKVELPKVDDSKPKTRIQLRLHTGQTHEIEVNLDARVAVLFDYAIGLSGVQGQFQLIAGFPPKPLTEVNQTIEEAGLEDSKVIQKV